MRGQRHAPAALYPGKDPVLIVQEAGWAPGPVWLGVENIAPTGIRSPDRPAHSQSLYRLRCLAHISSYKRGGKISKSLKYEICKIAPGFILIRKLHIDAFVPYSKGTLSFQVRALFVVHRDTVDRTVLCLDCKVNSF